MSKSSPAARASRAASETTQTRQHIRKHHDHRRTHELIAQAAESMVIGDDHSGMSGLARLAVEQHGTRIPMLPKEAAAVDSLIADHAGATVTLTRRDVGETGPLLAHIGDDSYEIDENGAAAKTTGAA